MSLKTLKRKLGFLRKTLKNYVKSGGGPVKPLSVLAKEYVPGKLNPIAKEYVPGKLNTAAKEYIPDKPLSARSMNNTTSLVNEWAKIRERIENAVAIDCEMVGVDNESALAHVAIVDFEGKKVYDKYVIPKGGIESITDYRTKYSGITPAKLKHLDKRTHSYETVKREVHKILKDKMIVGHGLINDFKVLEYIPNSELVWDTTEIDIFKQNHPGIPGLKQARKLKVIAKEFANNNIQLNTKSGHSPLEDARASMNLYRVSFNYPKIVYENMSK